MHGSMRRREAPGTSRPRRAALIASRRPYVSAGAEPRAESPPRLLHWPQGAAPCSGPGGSGLAVAADMLEVSAGRLDSSR